MWFLIAAQFMTFTKATITPNTPEKAAALAVKAGDDLCCGEDYESLNKAVKEGLVTEAEIDNALGHVLTARFRLGLFDPPGTGAVRPNPIFRKTTRSIIGCCRLKVASESIVLLKNERRAAARQKKNPPYRGHRSQRGVR